MDTFKIKGGSITLNRLLKMMGWSPSGAEANALIDAGRVKVNGTVETRRRNKLLPGTRIDFEGKTVVLE